MRVIQSNDTLKRRVNQTLAECDKTRKHRAPNKLTEYLGNDCLLSRYSSNLEQSMRRKVEQINDARERLLRRDERSGVIKSGWYKECETVSCFSYTENSFNLSETCAEATENYLTKLSKGCLRLFGNDAALGVVLHFL